MGPYKRGCLNPAYRRGFILHTYYSYLHIPYYFAKANKLISQKISDEFFLHSCVLAKFMNSDKLMFRFAEGFMYVLDKRLGRTATAARYVLNVLRIDDYPVRNLF
jgi:hypothetical protein